MVYVESFFIYNNETMVAYTFKKLLYLSSDYVNHYSLPSNHELFKETLFALQMASFYIFPKQPFSFI